MKYLVVYCLISNIENIFSDFFLKFLYMWSISSLTLLKSENTFFPLSPLKFVEACIVP